MSGNDFRNDFWYLILKEDSITQGEARAQEIRLLNKDSIDLIDRFIEFVEKVLANPKKELREIQGIKDIKKVKPVPRTFMEIASTGFKKKLTSRDTIESYNVAENKYIYFMIDKSISNWLNNTNNCLKNIRILDPFCGSGFFTHILVEYLFMNLKNDSNSLSKKIFLWSFLFLILLNIKIVTYSPLSVNILWFTRIIFNLLTKSSHMDINRSAVT